jgi:hypothetical protein
MYKSYGKMTVPYVMVHLFFGFFHAKRRHTTPDMIFVSPSSLPLSKVRNTLDERLWMKLYELPLMRKETLHVFQLVDYLQVNQSGLLLNVINA